MAKKRVDTKPASVVALDKDEERTITDRLYGHRSTLRGLLNETDKLLDWLKRKHKV